MSSPNPTDPREEQASEPSTFGDILTQFEQEQKSEAPADQTLQGTVISVTAEAVVVDIGRKMEGVLPMARLLEAGAETDLKAGDVIPVMVTGRNEEGYYELSTLKVKRPTDWSGFEKAFEEKAAIAGRVAEVVKGGLRVDIGVRAFMPASRSGAKDPAEMEKLVGQEIRCRITKLDTVNEDVVVDRRVLLEEESAAAKQRAFESLAEGAVVHGTVRTVTDYGAFVDLGGIDGLLHIADMSWHRVGKASDVVAVGDSVEVKVLKIDPATRKISLGMKQLQPDPWTLAIQNLKVGDRIQGKVVRLADFGAFVEVAPGVDGLIHLSSLAWGKRVRKPSDVVKLGDLVQAAVLDIKPAEKRISLGLKEALGDPWEEVPQRFPVGTILPEVPVTNLAKFGAFVDLGEGVEGMIHIADITGEKRLEHPKDVLSVGQMVRVKVLEVDKDKRRIRLGMKQLEPTLMDKFLADHQLDEVLSGLVVSVDGNNARIEVAEGIVALCRLPKEQPEAAASASEPQQSSGRQKVDLASMTAMLTSRWKQGPSETAPRAERLRRGEVKQVKIIKLDAERQTVEVELL
jgi:small subunit ribosomal protein S1